MTRIKAFKPWARHSFQWSETQSNGDLFGGDSADSVDQAVYFFVSSVTSATGTNHTRLSVAEPFHDASSVEVAIRCENPVLNKSDRKDSKIRQIKRSD